jgi:transposase-like protein
VLALLSAPSNQAGVSISEMALKTGINANRLHKWIRAGQQSSRSAAAAAVEPALPAFMPVLQIDSAASHDQKRPATTPAPVHAPSP